MGQSMLGGMSGGRLDCNVGGDAPKTEMMKNSQNGWNSEIRTRSEIIDQRPEWLGIEQQ